MKQETFTDIEYSCRKKKTKREEFLEIMEEIIPWDEWVGVIQPYYPKGKRGRPSMGIERLFIQRFSRFCPMCLFWHAEAGATGSLSVVCLCTRFLSLSATGCLIFLNTSRPLLSSARFFLL